MVGFKLEVPNNTKRLLDGYNPNHGGLSDRFEPRKVVDVDDYLNAFKAWNNKYGLKEVHTNIYDEVPNYKPLPENQNVLQELIYKIETGFYRIPLYAGTYVSYCINNTCKEEKITIVVNKPWNDLGMHNSNKKLEIIGNVNDYIGFFAEGGKIVVEGNYNNWLGLSIKGGEIIVKGNAYEGVGLNMDNGKITVEGNVYGSVGVGMSGGTIHLNGDYKRIGDGRKAVKIKGGDIYHKGKLIYKNRKKVSIWKRIF